MDSGNMLGLTLGVGALGTVLAYYGYNQLLDDPEELDTTDNKNNEGVQLINKNVGTTDELREIQNTKKTITTTPENKQQNSNILSDTENNTNDTEINTKTNQTDTIKEEVKNEITERTNEETDKKPKGDWSNFWKDAYNDKDTTNYLEK
jgi:hypothetical protein